MRGHGTLEKGGVRQISHCRCTGGSKRKEGRTFGRVDALCREVVEPLEVGVPEEWEQRRFVVS